jgi:hypothetical protein
VRIYQELLKMQRENGVLRAQVTELDERIRELREDSVSGVTPVLRGVDGAETATGRLLAPPPIYFLTSRGLMQWVLGDDSRWVVREASL